MDGMDEMAGPAGNVPRFMICRDGYDTKFRGFGARVI
jgi:hypothetical protein